MIRAVPPAALALRLAIGGLDLELPAGVIAGLEKLRAAEPRGGEDRR